MRAGRIVRWPFVVGMSLYAADSLIFVVAQDYIGLGFHAFWLVFLWTGLRTVGPIQAARAHRAAAAAL